MGADISGGATQAGGKVPETGEESLTFRDPKEYEHMPMEERRRLTEKMMGKHKRWVYGMKAKYKGKKQRGLGT